jgi:predicted ATPase
MATRMTRMKRINADSNSDRMYVQKVSLENIRSIKKLEMEFPNPAGWHVIIGDNGSGKSTVLKAICYALLGVNDGLKLRVATNSWLNSEADFGDVLINFTRNFELDGENQEEEDQLLDLNQLISRITFVKATDVKYNSPTLTEDIPDGTYAVFHVGNGKEPVYKRWGQNGWFSAAYGPFRRFSGGNPDNDRIFKSFPRLGAHLSLFGEDVALTEAIEWVKELDYKRLKELEKPDNGKDNTIIYHNLIRFINESKLLPHNAIIEGIDKDGIIFKDGNGTQIPVLELSDGYRSILSLTFELIRQLVRVYGAQAVFADIEKGKMEINLPGVVLIDEIDAHLHPSWQVDVGFWFTKYFPQLQFIVTTHSPLVCRAAEKGSIWRLAKPGTDSEAQEITGIEKDRLVYGNILDAYGTELFGKNTVRSTQSNKKLERLGRLNMLYALGKIKPTEEKERLKLQKILSTDDPTGF